MQFEKRSQADFLFFIGLLAPTTQTMCKSKPGTMKKTYPKATRNNQTMPSNCESFGLPLLVICHLSLRLIPLILFYRYSIIKGMTTMIESKWLDIGEAADKIGCTVSYIRQLLRAGELSGQKIGERAWIVENNSVLKFVKKPKKTGRPRVSDKNSRKSA